MGPASVIMRKWTAWVVALACMALPVCALAEDYGTLKRQADELFYTARYDEATDAYLKAKAVNDKDPELYLRLGIIHYRRGRVEDAIGTFRQAVTLDPEYAEAHFFLGTTLALAGRYNDSVLELEEAMRLQPNHAWAIETAANVYYRLGALDKALELQESLLELQPDDRFVHGQLAQLYLGIGQYAKARAELEQAVKDDPEYPGNYAMLGGLDYRMGFTDRAIEHWRKTLEHWPEDGSLWLALGQSLFALEDYEQASEAFNAALKLNPDNRIYRQYQQLAQQRLGHEGAWGKLREFVEDKPEHLRIEEWEQDTLDGPWEAATEIETAHFVVKTNLPHETREAIVQLVDGLFERVRVILGHVAGLEPVAPEKPFNLYLFGTWDEFEAYLRSTHVRPEWHLRHRGHLALDRNQIVLLFRRDGAVADLAHEFSHLWMRRALADDIPRWVNEGLAEYVQMRVDGERYFADVGGQHRTVLREGLAQDLLLSIDELTEWEVSGDPLFYACAWSLVTFLIEAESGDLQGRLVEYLTEAHSSDAFKRIIGRPDVVDTQWRGFISQVLEDQALRWRIAN